MKPDSYNLNFKCPCGKTRIFLNIVGQLAFTCLCGRTSWFNLPGLWVEKELKEAMPTKQIPYE